MSSQEDEWEVSYLPWRDFRAAVLSGKGDRWNSLMKGDLVMGGMDFSIDFLYFIFLSLLIKSLLILSSSSSINYRTNPPDCVTFLLNMLRFAKTTTVWPHPEELFMAGAKVQGYETLRVASLSMGLSVPMYATANNIIKTQDFLTKLKKNSFNGVLKREFSMRGEHVITPDTKNPANVLQKALAAQEKTWGKVKASLGEPMWFMQPFVAHLLTIGEVRVVIVGGRIAYKMTTTPKSGDPGAWNVSDKATIRPIHTHRWVVFFSY